MNTIASLQSHISKATSIADAYASKVSNIPNSLSSKLCLMTLNHHITELQNQLKKEKNMELNQ